LFTLERKTRKERIRKNEEEFKDKLMNNIRRWYEDVLRMNGESL
jgi:hypothetical protein